MLGGMGCGCAQRSATTLRGNIETLVSLDIRCLHVATETVADLKDWPNADKNLLWLKAILDLVHGDIFTQYAYPQADELLRRLGGHLNKPRCNIVGLQWNVTSTTFAFIWW